MRKTLLKFWLLSVIGFVISMISVIINLIEGVRMSTDFIIMWIFLALCWVLGFMSSST